MSLEAELQRAGELSVAGVADAIQSIGFECTLSGACCKAVDTDDGDREGHTATVFPDKVHRLANASEDAFGESYDWRDITRPIGIAVDSEARSGPTSPRAWAGERPSARRGGGGRAAGARCGNWMRLSPSGRPRSPAPRPTASSSRTRRPDATGRHAARRSIARPVASR